MAHPFQYPLIPANAGTQMAGAGVGSMSAAPIQQISKWFDLGPGIRRDERNGGYF